MAKKEKPHSRLTPIQNIPSSDTIDAEIAGKSSALKAERSAASSVNHFIRVMAETWEVIIPDFSAVASAY
jgi:hypothetical protein